jgi:hypothetical protein
MRSKARVATGDRGDMIVALVHAGGSARAGRRRSGLECGSSCRLDQRLDISKYPCRASGWGLQGYFGPGGNGISVWSIFSPDMAEAHMGVLNDMAAAAGSAVIRLHR